MKPVAVFLLKLLLVSIFFSNHAFSRNIILDCDVTLVGIEGKDMASNDTEVIDINLKAKTIFLAQKQFLTS